MNHQNKHQQEQQLSADHSLDHFRFKTPRRRKRLAREAAEKILRALYRERDALYARRRALGWVPLDPPIVRGWKRHFVLRDDVARSPQAQFFEKLLDRLNTAQLSHRRDFRKKARRFGKKTYVERGQHLAQADEWTWRKWNLGEKESKLFEARLVPASWPKGSLKKAYVFLEPWRYVLRVEPNLITKTRERDEELEARIQALENFIERRALNGPANRLIRGSAYTYWKRPGVRPSERWEFENLPLHAVLYAWRRRHCEKRGPAMRAGLRFFGGICRTLLLVCLYSGGRLLTSFVG